MQVERTPLGFAAFCAWLNVPPEKMPEQLGRFHECHATAEAWGRVEQAMRAAVREDDALQLTAHVRPLSDEQKAALQVMLSGRGREIVVEPMLYTHHFGKPMPITGVLLALAAQEGNDYDEGSAMQLAAETIRRLLAAEDRLRAELSAAIGYMRNAQIDLETGATKATAVRTIKGGIARAEAALTPTEGTAQ